MKDIIKTLKMIAGNCALPLVQRNMIEDCCQKLSDYEWHDLRENPLDLPDVETEVEVVCERKFFSIKLNKEVKRHVRTHGFYEDGTVLEDDSEWAWHDLDGEWNEEADCYIIPEGWWEYRHYNYDDNYNNIIDDKVIAWRKIDTFE